MPTECYPLTSLLTVTVSHPHAVNKKKYWGSNISLLFCQPLACETELLHNSSGRQSLGSDSWGFETRWLQQHAQNQGQGPPIDPPGSGRVFEQQQQPQEPQSKFMGYNGHLDVTKGIRRGTGIERYQRQGHVPVSGSMYYQAQRRTGELSAIPEEQIIAYANHRWYNPQAAAPLEGVRAEMVALG